MKKILSLMIILLCFFCIIGCNNKDNSPETYKIIYVLNGGSLPNNYAAEFNSDEGLTTLPIPIKEGYNFSGWYMEGSLITNIKKGIDHDVTLSAEWEKIEEIKYNITYNLDGGTIEEGRVDSFTSQVGVDKLPIPVKEGFTFMGWYMDDVLVSMIEKGTTKDVVLNAKWEEKVVGVYYNITYIFFEGDLPENAPKSYLAGVGCELVSLENTNGKFSFWVDQNFNKVDRITSYMTGDIVLTAVFTTHPEPITWKYNLNEFNGQGMKYQIMVDDVDKYDPNSENYYGSNKAMRQTQLQRVEAEYNIVIEYVDGNSILGEGYSYNGHQKIIENCNGEVLKDVYAFNLSSLYIPYLQDVIYKIGNQSGSEILDKLYMGSGNELVKYEQDSLSKALLSHKGIQYGYNNQFILPDHLMYYNVDLVKDLGLEDPAELWFKGKWTVDKFNEYVTRANSALKNNGFDVDSSVLDMDYADAVIGITASTGNKTLKDVPPIIYISQEFYKDNINLLSDLYHKGIYTKNEIQNEYLSSRFESGKSIFTSFKIDYLFNDRYYNPVRTNFSIGVVPYPTITSDPGISVTTTNINEAIELGNNEYLINNSGEYIKGLDLSSSTFTVPVTETNGFYFLKKENPKNNIDLFTIVNILHDIDEGYECYDYNFSQLKPLEEEEKYRYYLRRKFNRNIDVEVVMSCMNNMYYDTIYKTSNTACDGDKLKEGSYYLLIQNMVKNGYDIDEINRYVNLYKTIFKSLGEE